MNKKILLIIAFLIIILLATLLIINLKNMNNKTISANKEKVADKKSYNFV